MTTFDEGGGGVLWRLGQLERFKETFEVWRPQVDNDRRDLVHVLEVMRELREEVSGLRRTVLGFAFVVAASAITFALSILVATGKL